MTSLLFPFEISPKYEVMHFTTEGTPHRHNVEELAIAVSGAGVIVVDGVEIVVDAGSVVLIPAQAEHYMVPSEGETLAMLICYRTEVPVA